MVFCTYCGQSFTRDEHLERHILTHTNIKPFKCFTCHMSFARKDLLQRHYTVHGRNQNNEEGLPFNPGMIPKSAGRTPIACSNCAKTKTKCDKKFPCSRCAQRNLHCTLRPTRRVTKQAAARIEEVQAEQASHEIDAASGRELSVSTADSSESKSPRSQKSSEDRDDSRTDSCSSDDDTHNGAGDATTRADVELQYLHENCRITAGAAPNLMPDMVSPFSLHADLTNASTMTGYGYMPPAISTEFSDTDASFLMDWTQMPIMDEFDATTLSPPDADIGWTGRSHASDFGKTDSTLGSFRSFHPIPNVYHQPITEASFAGLNSTRADAQPSSSPPITHSSSGDSTFMSADAIAAAQGGWSVFRCTPTVPPSRVPRTAQLHLKRLQTTLKDHESWSDWTPCCDEDAELRIVGDLDVPPVRDATRDRLMAVTQAFLHKALEIHKVDVMGGMDPSESLHTYGSSFLLLPPARTLVGFLKAYTGTFERFMPLTPGGQLDANDLLTGGNVKVSSLLVLMMMSHGAATIATPQARALTGGLIEACRISLFDSVETNISMASDPALLKAALLFTDQAAWSGDKWHMDIAMGQRGMYSAMLRHSGMLEAREALDLEGLRHTRDAMGLWKDWMTDEGCNRLVYCWAILDQELSLFNDTTSVFNINDFGTPLPDEEALWRASSASEWAELLLRSHPSNQSASVRPLPLRTLFRHFLDDEITSRGIKLTPLHLRLLLHPLQTLVAQTTQLLACFSDTTRKRNGARSISATSTRASLEHIKGLLQRWHSLATSYLKSHSTCPIMQASLIMYHLISLNAVTSFPDIERLARREDFDGTYESLLRLHKRCIRDVEESHYHAGQVLGLIRNLPRSIRPSWWPGAVYRTALVLWTDALRHNGSLISPHLPTNDRNRQTLDPSQVIVPIDALPADHPVLAKYLAKKEGTPVLTKRDGGQVGLDNAAAVLAHCVAVIDEATLTALSEGIRGKLERLMRG